MENIKGLLPQNGKAGGVDKVTIIWDELGNVIIENEETVVDEIGVDKILIGLMILQSYLQTYKTIMIMQGPEDDEDEY